MRGGCSATPRSGSSSRRCCCRRWSGRSTSRAGRCSSPVARRPRPVRLRCRRRAPRGGRFAGRTLSPRRARHGRRRSLRGGVAVTALAGWRLTGLLRAEDLALALAAVLIGLLWIRARLGLDLSSTMIARGVWIGVGVLTLIVLWAAISLARGAMPTSLLSPPFRLTTGPWPLDAIVTWLCGFCLVLPAVGGGDALPQGAHELEPPRVRRSGASRSQPWSSGWSSRPAARCCCRCWCRRVSGGMANAPLAGLTQHLVASSLVRDVMAIALVAAAVMMLTPAATPRSRMPTTRCASCPSKGCCRPAWRRCTRGSAPRRGQSRGRRGRRPDRAGQRRARIWLARAYAVSLAVTVVLKAWALARIRRRRTEPLAFKTPFNLQVGAREVPVGLNAVALLAGASAVAMLAIGDMPSIAAIGLLGGLCLLFLLGGHESLDSATVEERGFVRSAAVGGTVAGAGRGAKPGNVLVPVRNPHSLGARRRRTSGGRRSRRRRDDGAARSAWTSTSDDSATTAPTPAERQLLSRGRRARRAYRPAGAPADRARRTTCSTRSSRRVLRLRSSEVYVGESATLSADEQARLLGEAWERAEKPERARRPARHPSPQRAHRCLPPRRASARRSRPAISTSSTASGSTRSRRSARTCITTTSCGPPSRKWNNNSTVPSATTRSRRSAQVARPADELAAVVARARLLAPARHDRATVTPATSRTLLTELEHRGSGRRVPRAAAQGRRRGLRVPRRTKRRKRCSRRWRRRTSRRC